MTENTNTPLDIYEKINDESSYAMALKSMGSLAKLIDSDTGDIYSTNGQVDQEKCMQALGGPESDDFITLRRATAIYDFMEGAKNCSFISGYDAGTVYDDSIDNDISELSFGFNFSYLLNQFKAYLSENGFNSNETNQKCKIAGFFDNAFNAVKKHSSKNGLENIMASLGNDNIIPFLNACELYSGEYTNHWQYSHDLVNEQLIRIKKAIESYEGERYSALTPHDYVDIYRLVENYKSMHEDFVAEGEIQTVINNISNGERKFEVNTEKGVTAPAQS